MLRVQVSSNEVLVLSKSLHVQGNTACMFSLLHREAEVLQMSSFELLFDKDVSERLLQEPSSRLTTLFSGTLACTLLMIG